MLYIVPYRTAPLTSLSQICTIEEQPNPKLIPGTVASPLARILDFCGHVCIKWEPTKRCQK
jgi:hypothetical protein